VYVIAIRPAAVDAVRPSDCLHDVTALLRGGDGGGHLPIRGDLPGVLLRRRVQRVRQPPSPPHLRAVNYLVDNFSENVRVSKIVIPTSTYLL
jgi:hypothetical protein